LPEILGEVADRKFAEQELSTIHRLLESQRERLRMYTSCGWFFEDFDRIEPRNNVAYAARAVSLVHVATGIDLSNIAVQGLKFVVSNRSGINGDEVFRRQIRKADKVNSY
jgi:hypothetical protein